MMSANNIESHTAQLDEVLEALSWSFTSIDHIHHVMGQHKRRAIPDKTSIIKANVRLYFKILNSIVSYYCTS